jgi:glutathione S-transferase
VKVWRIPFSTNCERVAIAAGVTGIPVDWVEVDAYDRAPVKEASGQGRVPIAELDGEIVVGSLNIIGRVAPQLWPDGRRMWSEVETFLEWFERVWMQAIGVVFRNEDPERVQRAGQRLDGYVERFDSLLDGREHLFGPLTIADIAAYPFLKYATDRNPDDDYAVHDQMRAHQSIEGRPNVAAWLARMAQLPQA